MAAPTPVTMSTVIPAGVALEEGFRIRIGFSRAPTIGLWLKSAKPFGFDDEGPFDTTTQDRVVGDHRTRATPALVTDTDVTASAAFDPDAVPTIRTMLMGKGNEGAITLQFPNGTLVTFFGVIGVFDPQEQKEKEQPMANVTIRVTNWDPTNHVYAAPVWGTAVGT